MNEWKRTEQTISGIPCLQHKVTKELCAFGSGGQVFEVSAVKLTAIIYRQDGSEAQVKVPPNKLNDWVTRLGSPGL